MDDDQKHALSKLKEARAAEAAAAVAMDEAQRVQDWDAMNKHAEIWTERRRLVDSLQSALFPVRGRR